MISKQAKETGILARLLEKCVKILVKKECKKIGKIKINIIASSFQIIKGIIEKIDIIAKDINYKDLLFDEIELEASDVKVIFRLKNKEFNFKNNIMIKFKISLSENSLRTILFSNSWDWVGGIISKGILNQNELEDIRIKDDKILIKTSKGINKLNQKADIDIKAKDGRLYLENTEYNKSIRIPIEDKVCIEYVSIKNNLIKIFAKSSINF
tara:strand:- start:3235 stop:3867 length:633 start_codon:yes stop_codon:yes gene_type:complete